MQKMAARTLQGTVTSQKMNKTITVVVARRTKHPKYGKYINLSTKYHVHDEKDAKRAFELAGAKLPMNTTFVKRGTNG